MTSDPIFQATKEQAGTVLRWVLLDIELNKRFDNAMAKYAVNKPVENYGSISGLGLEPVEQDTVINWRNRALQFIRTAT
jgi:hypothetical protein